VTPTVHDVNWIQIAQLALSILGILSSVVIAIIAFLARSWFANLTADIAAVRAGHVATLAKMDLEREVIRKEHREDVAALRGGLGDLAKKQDDSIRRVHERVDHAQTVFVSMSTCAMHMDGQQTFMKSQFEGLREDLSEVRKLITDSMRAQGTQS
jgi:hypothetical protein